ncbi:MAG: hypothetical protein ACREA0_27405, partial [bacterium]
LYAVEMGENAFARIKANAIAPKGGRRAQEWTCRPHPNRRLDYQPRAGSTGISPPPLAVRVAGPGGPHT